MENELKITIVGYKKQQKFAQGVTNDEDAELITYLKTKGLNVVSTIWNDPNIDWTNFDVAILKSTWDYHNHYTAFIKWLEKLKKLNIKVLNPVEIIKWNSHKKYLKDLAEKGLPVIPARFLKKGSDFDHQIFDSFFDSFKTDKLVIKPCISAGAQNTIILNKNEQKQYQEQIIQLLHSDDCIVQPFVEEIKNGEWSFLFFNGKYSHCSLKTPKKGDFRVQHYHGGTISYPVLL